MMCHADAHHEALSTLLLSRKGDTHGNACENKGDGCRLCIIRVACRLNTLFIGTSVMPVPLCIAKGWFSGCGSLSYHCLAVYLCDGSPGCTVLL